MFKLLAAFGLGWYFGRNPGAGQALISSGQQLLDAQTGQPVANTVLPGTSIVSPQQAGTCPRGLYYWQGGNMGGSCVDKATYQALQDGRLVQ